MANFFRPRFIKTAVQVTLISTAISFSSCNPVLGALTANWKSQLTYLKTDTYQLRIKQNLSMGCPQAETSLNDKAFHFENVSLPEAIRTLTDNESRIEFVNINPAKVLRIDLEYESKITRTFESSKDTVLKLLGKSTGYSVSTSRVAKKVYSLKIVDPDKLKPSVYPKASYKVPENSIFGGYKYSGAAARKSSFRKTGDIFEFNNCSLATICRQLENKTALYFDYDLSDTNLYSMKIPTVSSSEMRRCFNSRGIDLIEVDMEIPITRIIFNDQSKLN